MEKRKGTCFSSSSSVCNNDANEYRSLEPNLGTYLRHSVQVKIRRLHTRFGLEAVHAFRQGKRTLWRPDYLQEPHLYSPAVDVEGEAIQWEADFAEGAPAVKAIVLAVVVEQGWQIGQTAAAQTPGH